MLRPIETTYCGHRFRSRLEARWAIAFERCGIEWQYEPEGYQLPAGWYVPDFYLPRFNSGLWIEVKPAGRPLTASELDRAKDLARFSGHTVVFAIGYPTFGMAYWGWEPDGGTRDHIIFGEYTLSESRAFTCTGESWDSFPYPHLPWSSDYSDLKVIHALSLARSTRFH